MEDNKEISSIQLGECQYCKSRQPIKYIVNGWRFGICQTCGQEQEDGNECYREDENIDLYGNVL